MKKVLVTGGTVFVSRNVAEYFVNKGYEVYVLNRNNRKQSKGVFLLKGDRLSPGNLLKYLHFDAVIDVTAYNANDILKLLPAIGSFDSYIMISSSAVYPEFAKQPFIEDTELSENKYWGKYGLDKIAAEKVLLECVPDAYILRPSYIYGPMNNVYREAFVFECALEDRFFYIPSEGNMKLQFLYINDLCRFIDIIIDNKPEEHIFNLGNRNSVSIKDWVSKCYACANKIARFISVPENIEQRNYFSFYNYEYYLDVSKQYSLMSDTISLEEGLKKSYKWYLENADKVKSKPFIEYI
ncbi:MAG: NAD-dependent epimerase/dehydratase family protein, partial [Treponema sp.]|nr:NAD-dependent epimerase/dehydratase family protein [Treponema sp.]